MALSMSVVVWSHLGTSHVCAEGFALLYVHSCRFCCGGFALLNREKIYKQKGVVPHSKRASDKQCIGDSTMGESILTGRV